MTRLQSLRVWDIKFWGNSYFFTYTSAVNITIPLSLNDGVLLSITLKVKDILNYYNLVADLLEYGFHYMQWFGYRYIKARLKNKLLSKTVLDFLIISHYCGRGKISLF